MDSKHAHETGGQQHGNSPHSGSKRSAQHAEYHNAETKRNGQSISGMAAIKDRQMDEQTHQNHPQNFSEPGKRGSAVASAKWLLQDAAQHFVECRDFIVWQQGANESTDKQGCFLLAPHSSTGAKGMHWLLGSKAVHYAKFTAEAVCSAKPTGVNAQTSKAVSCLPHTAGHELSAVHYAKFIAEAVCSAKPTEQKGARTACILSEA
ncbi:hypothetical protein ABBQ38_006378 [Trebouxia sp. C0009 RCD-2024]